MKNILIAAGMVAGAATGAIAYFRKRRMAKAELEHVKQHLKGHFRKNKHKMEQVFS